MLENAPRPPCGGAGGVDEAGLPADGDSLGTGDAAAGPAFAGDGAGPAPSLPPTAWDTGRLRRPLSGSPLSRRAAAGGPPVLQPRRPARAGRFPRPLRVLLLLLLLQKKQ